MPDSSEKIGKLTGAVEAIQQDIRDIKDYMEEAVEHRVLEAQLRGENATNIAAIKNAMEQFAKYQATCETARVEDRKNIAALQEDNRFLKRTIKWVSAVFVALFTLLESLRH